MISAAFNGSTLQDSTYLGGGLHLPPPLGGEKIVLIFNVKNFYAKI